MARGKYIITAKFDTSITQEAGFGNSTVLFFKDIKDKDGQLISRSARMKMSKMASLIWYKKGKTYRIKLCEAMKAGDDWMWYPVMIQDGNIRYSIVSGNNIKQELRTPACIQVTEHFTAIDRPKKRYTAPLSSW